jgi:hypothetical protein
MTGVAWIIIVQLIVLWRPLTRAIAAVRANPGGDIHLIAPHVPGGSLVLLVPPFALAALWWWMRRSRPAV